MKIALAFALALAAGQVARAQSTDAAPREVKVTVAYHVRDFSRCVADALTHSRPDLKHAAVMVNHIRQFGREVTVRTRLLAASPPAEKWYEGVDWSIGECREDSGKHFH